MSDCSPFRLADNGNEPSSSQSSGGSLNAQMIQDGNIGKVREHQRRSNVDQQQQQQQHIDNNSNSRRTRRTTNHQNQGFVGLENDPNGNERDRARSPNDSMSSKSGQLRYDARNVIELFIPVSLCMLIVVGTMKATDGYRYSSQTVVWYAQVMFTDQTVDTSTRVWQSFANAFIMLILIVIMTTALILLYKFRCYKTIHGWLILSSLILLFMFAIMYIAEILKVYNIPMDVYTLMIFIWNFGVVGMVCIHWKGPLLLQQGYLIVISALLALVFIRSLPDWTTWTVLGIVSIWDLVAVLCPRGPLRILVETAQERNEAIFPALIYSSTMLWEVASTVIVSTTPSITMADMNPNSSNRDGDRRESNQANRRHNRRSNQGERSNQQASGSSSNRRRQANLAAQKRSQHPVEIHYEGATEPPEVDIIQPTLSSTSDNWTAPIVRTHRITHDNLRSEHIDSQGRSSSGIAIQSGDPNEATVNFRPNQETPVEIIQVEEERGVKLGLGDFIFFSLLVGKASSYGDWTITLSCYVAILVGLCLTLSLLAVFRKALPALPISIAFGLCSFFMSYMFAMPFAEKLSINQVFI